MNKHFNPVRHSVAQNAMSNGGKNAFVFFLTLWCCSLIFCSESRAEFFGNVKTGLTHSEEDRYGFSYYVPTYYSQDRLWPLVIALHDEGGEGKDYIQQWAEVA